MTPTENSGFWVGPGDAPDTYELITELGSGGEGQVWKAVVPLSDSGRRYVAVKMLPATGQDGETQLWTRYGHLLSAIAHPGVVRVTDVFIGPAMHRNDGSPKTGAVRYIVMDFIDGTTLREWITDHPEAAAAERIAQLRNIAAALDELHSGRNTDASVAHGDVKPENIIVRPNGGSILVDLGLTRLTDAGGITGKSNPYASPELHLPGTPATTASDAFAFAATLAHTLTGEPPPLDDDDHLSLDELRSRMAHSPVTSHRPAMVKEIVAALIAAPDDRPRHLSQWLNAITSTLSQTTNPVPAEKPVGSRSQTGSPTRRSRFGTLRRRKPLAMIAAVTVVVLVLAWVLFPGLQTVAGEIATATGISYDAEEQVTAGPEAVTLIDEGQWYSSASDLPVPAIDTEVPIETNTPLPAIEDAPPIDSTDAAEPSVAIPGEADLAPEQPVEEPSAQESLNEGQNEVPPLDDGSEDPPVAPGELENNGDTNEPEIDPGPGFDPTTQPPVPLPTTAPPAPTKSALITPPVGPTVAGGNCSGSLVGEHNHTVNGVVVATTLIYYQSATGKNCALLRKRVNVGEKSYVGLTLCNARGECATDRDYYLQEAGPVTVYGKGMCITFAISVLRPDRTAWVLTPQKSDPSHCT